ncbi:LytR/AlgR family response regulator transcription factor [Chitinophaga deserti]|uniref:LytR/AlgR family response regulator transcription factor n=1 Tax=Chitinophaga deserti TaxID=2164099 RepID=UPI000D6B41CC|nr:LytTR family DNA-binding domain-containing protein [Chitinophaga deserti]
MRILILEDEPLVATHLIKLVKELEPAWQILGPAASLREATLLMQAGPDLILADIQLSDGISLDLFHHLQPAIPVIFTTAYDQYAIRAFKINSIDYLLKPVDPEELAAAFRKYALLRDKYASPQFMGEIMQFVQNQQQKQLFKETFTVHSGKNVYMFPLSEIAGFSKSEVIYLHHADGRQWITDFRSLDEIEELLDPVQCFRANRQFIVNRAYLAGFKTDDTSRLTLHFKAVNLPAVMVSKDKAAAFRAWLS